MNKYHSRRTSVNDMVFASAAEARRYEELLLLQHVREIQNLRCQVSYRIVVNGETICTYVADFQYFDCRKNETVIEDVKGVRTPVYRLKAKLMKAVNGITIQEIAA